MIDLDIEINVIIAKALQTMADAFEESDMPVWNRDDVVQVLRRCAARTITDISPRAH